MFVLVNIKVKSLPAIPEQLGSKYYVDQAISNSVYEPTVVRNNQDIDFNIFTLTNINSITLKTQAVNNNHAVTKSYVDQFHQENERSRRDSGTDFYNESIGSVKKTR